MLDGTNQPLYGTAAHTIYHGAERLTLRSWRASACSFTTPQSQLLSGGDESSPCLIVKERDTGLTAEFVSVFRVDGASITSSNFIVNTNGDNKLLLVIIVLIFK